MLMQWLQEGAATRFAEWTDSLVTFAVYNWRVLAVPAVCGFISLVVIRSVAGAIAVIGVSLIVIWAVGTADRPDTAWALAVIFCVAVLSAAWDAMAWRDRANTATAKWKSMQTQLDDTIKKLNREIEWRIAGQEPIEESASEAEPSKPTRRRTK